MKLKLPYTRIVPGSNIVWEDDDIAPAKRGSAGRSLHEDTFRIRTQYGLLILNFASGAVRLNKRKSSLHPHGQEFKVLRLLITSENNIATYADLLGERNTSSERRKLTFVIRNLKIELGILSAKKPKNKDVIKNMRGVGYKLIVPT